MFDLEMIKSVYGSLADRVSAAREIVGEACSSRIDLQFTHGRFAMHDLALKITFVDYVEIDESHRADAGGGKVEPEWRPESAGTDT